MAKTLQEWIEDHLGKTLTTTNQAGAKRFVAYTYEMGDRGRGVWFYGPGLKLKTYRKIPDRFRPKIGNSILEVEKNTTIKAQDSELDKYDPTGRYRKSAIARIQFTIDTLEEAIKRDINVLDAGVSSPDEWTFETLADQLGYHQFLRIMRGSINRMKQQLQERS